VRLRPAAPPAGLEVHVRAGLLAPADVHVASALCRVAGDEHPRVLLAAALAVRAPRLQHVCVDLHDVGRLVPSDDADPELDLDTLDLWPDDVDAWQATLAASPAVTHVTDPHGWHPPPSGSQVAPLVLVGHRLYLDRLWRDEVAVAAELRDRATRPIPEVEPSSLTVHLDALFDGDAPDRQRLAAATGALRRLAVIAGGPGTGKTTTVARLLALLDDHAVASGRPTPTVALAAPTGKAAQRLTASLREAADALGRPDTDPTVARLRSAEATTVHRLLGPRGDSRTRFRHDAGDPLPHDVVVVDETSMVSLALVARLLDAIRPDARLVLLGDPEQLASVEAGSVLGDVVGDATTAPRASAPSRAALAAAAGHAHLTGIGSAPAAGIDDAIVVLERVHRFRVDSGIADVATAIQRGDADAAVARLRAGGDVRWFEAAAVGSGPADLREVRASIVEAAGSLVDAARRGDASAALARLDDVRVLCAHLRGPAGVEGWVDRIEGWLAAARPDAAIRGLRYPGRPVLVTANDHRARLVNGDVGVLVRIADGGVAVALPALDGDGARLLSPSRLPAAETVHAMTVHKSQGSQFRHVVVVLPDPGSPLLTRELLYTAVTRARDRVSLLGTEAALRTAIATRALRASGLGEALRGG
jgi:exodeoxyribonuclease V alpha subunit